MRNTPMGLNSSGRLLPNILKEEVIKDVLEGKNKW